MAVEAQGTWGADRFFWIRLSDGKFLKGGYLDRLGGRDSNPDTVVQRAVPAFLSASFRACSRRSIRHHLRPLLPVCLRSRAACLFVSQVYDCCLAS